MEIQLIEEGTHTAEMMYRFGATMTAVSTRIVVLAHLLGVRLETEGEVQHILDRSNPALREASLRQGGHASRSRHRAWEELRGLIVLRCNLVRQALEELGLGLTYEITSEVERGLAKAGVKPGSDGFDPHGLLNHEQS